MSAEKNIYTHLHLRGNELRGFVFERLESDPDPIDGRIYYNVAKNEFRACISGVWVNIFSIWHVDDDGNITTDKQVIIKNNLIVEGDTSSGGEGEYTPSAGLDETRLQEYLDEHKYVTEGDIAELIPSNIATVDYVNTKFNSIDLSPYATTTELNALANRVVPIETWMDNVGQHITYDAELDAIVINHNLIVTKDTSSGGEGENTGASGIRGIYVNGEPYTDTDGDGFIDLGSISGGVSEITASMIDSALGYTPANNASLANYLPLSGGFMDNNASIKWYANAHSWDNAPDGLIGVSMVSDSLGYYGGLSFKGFYGIQIRAYGGDTDDISVRGYDASNWGTWRTLIHSGNYSDYAYPKNGKGYMSFDAQGRPVMSNNQGYAAYNTNGQIEEVMWLDTSNLLQLGGTTSQKVNIYGELTINYQDAIHSGNIGSYAMRWMGGANTGADVNSFSFAAGAYGVASALNSPTSTGYGAVLNLPYRVGFRNAPDYMGQIYIPNGDDADRSIFYRTSLAETWQPWRRIVSEDDNGNVTLYGTHLFANKYIFMNDGGEGIYLSTDAISWHNVGNGWVRDIIVFGSNGNVGIGTTSPAYKLDVNGDISAMSALRIGGCGTSYCGLYPNNQITSSGDSSKLWLYNESGLVFYGTSLEIYPTAILYDKLGVGTTSPAYALDVVNTGRFKAGTASDNYTALRLTNAWYGGSGKKNTDIVMESAVGYRGGVIRCTIDAAYGEFDSLSFGAGDNDASSYIPYLTIAASGNVGIGTTEPQRELDVKGGIRATKPIFGYMYSTNTNSAAFIFDKPGSNYTGIGSDGVSDTIRFGACNVQGGWVSYNQKWKFYGDIIVTGDVASA